MLLIKFNFKTKLICISKMAPRLLKTVKPFVICDIFDLKYSCTVCKCTLNHCYCFVNLNVGTAETFSCNPHIHLGRFLYAFLH